MRWLRRRVRLLRRALTAALGLLPQRLAGCPPTVLAFRGRLGTGRPALPSQQRRGHDPPPPKP